MSSVIIRIYKSSSGQWAGAITVGGEEIGGIAGCSSPEDVEQAARDAGHDIESVEIV